MQFNKENPLGLPFLITLLLGISICVVGYFFDSLPGSFRKYLLLLLLSQAVICIALLCLAISTMFRKGLSAEGILAVLYSPIAFFISLIIVLFASGGAWGRPLRVRGKQVHPELREGTDWTRGERPDPSQLDEPTRLALEALWLHDAQKEHASVPAFSRIAWMLAAVGAPAELMEWSHRAALEEIEHTRLCFALAAGYAGRSHTVEAMPDLLLGGLNFEGDPLVTLAVESINDGCQLEDFNADVAAACAVNCMEPVTRAVLEQIAREERSHADFSWAVLCWTLQRNPEKILPAIEKALADLHTVRRPTAANWSKSRLVAKANADHLLQHGRLPDVEWEKIWNTRLEKTRERLSTMLVSDNLSSITA